MVTRQLQTTRKVDHERNPGDGADGSLTVRPSAVAKVAGMTVHEMDGVDLGSMRGFMASLAGAGPGLAAAIRRAVKAEISDGRAAVDICITVDYGCNVPEVVAEVRRRIQDRVRIMAGLDTRLVNIEVTDISLPDDKPAPLN